jgi:DNA-binding transcriptional LysR family regulator
VQDARIHDLDLNLLTVFDALLSEGSVTDAAVRLRLSVPATSRALGRLRRALDDPVLVRAGRGLVPTPFALRAAPRVRAVLEAARGVFTEERDLDLATLDRTFTIRINEGTAATLAPRLVGLVGAQAPHVTVRLLGEGTEDVEALRDGTVDLDVGVPSPAVDVREELLYEEPLVAVVAAARTPPTTLAQLCALPHVSASRRGRGRGPLDDALAEHGLTRRVAAVAGSFVVAALMAADSNLVALVPRRLAERHGPGLGVRVVDLPLDLPPVRIVQQWHARLDADPAQRWLRATVGEAAADRRRGGA